MRRVSFPGFIAAMSDLVKALNERISSNKEWDKNVSAKLEKMVSAVRLLLIILSCSQGSIDFRSKS